MRQPSGDARTASITPGSRSKNTERGTYLPPEASWKYTLMRLNCTTSLVAQCRYLIVVPKPLPRYASQVLDRGAQANANGAAQVLDRGAQAVARGTAR
jgi:hypothetical protein